MDLRNLVITPELLRLIAEIDEFKGMWSTMHTITPDHLQFLRKVATIESIGSSTRIEGSKLTDEQIETLLGGVSTKSFVTRDEQEVAGYAEVMEAIFDNHSEIRFTENYVKQLHSILLRHSSKDEQHRGEYKKHSNHVEAFNEEGKNLGIVFKTASPFDTPQKMRELLSWSHETLEDKSYHPLIVIGIFNVVFLAIHPFQDGNGRLSRALVTLLLLKSAYLYIPFSSLESVIEANKDAYYLALRRTQKTLSSDAIDWAPWLNFFIASIKRQKDHLSTKLQQPEQHAMLPIESVKILAYLAEHKRITITQAVEITGALRPTVKNRLKSLVEAELLARHGKARGTWYSLTSN